MNLMAALLWKLVPFKDEGTKMFTHKQGEAGVCAHVRNGRVYCDQPCKWIGSTDRMKPWLHHVDMNHYVL
jgi:hypothetical protein